jgi:sigma-B regulation protein RsbU (phosphoserine phosphatase)
MMWTSNLFGRAVNSLVLSRRLKKAYEDLDRELMTVAEIQQSLLPKQPPTISTLRIATHYQTSTRAGGDYYDFFDLGGGRTGILVADVAGHGTPAAVLMAILHAIAHLTPGGPMPPERLMQFLNARLVERYANPGAAFVTAFYGVYDERARTMTYALAGHPPPMRRDASGAVTDLDGGDAGPPLGLFEDARFVERTAALEPGDAVLFYTDGISEAMDAARKLYGTARLRAVFARAARGDSVPVARDEAHSILSDVLTDLYQFTRGAPPGDDQTLLIATVR